MTERINLLDKFQSPKYRGRTVSNSINTCGGGRSIVTERINLSDKFQSSNYTEETELAGNAINTCGSKSIVTERINLLDKFQSSSYRDRTWVQLYK